MHQINGGSLYCMKKSEASFRCENSNQRIKIGSNIHERESSVRFISMYLKVTLQSVDICYHENSFLQSFRKYLALTDHRIEIQKPFARNDNFIYF